MTTDLIDRRFLTVIGKGGTGKTTVAGALALLAASQGKRVLLAQTQSRERLSAMLETEYIGTANQPILPRIDAVNMDPEVCLEEYGLMILRIRALYKAVMDNRLVRGFLRAVPGMNAWSMLGKALFHARETTPDGAPRYDLVILDAPATGHGLQMLRVPQVICEIAPPGLLRREAERGLELLRDPQRAGMVLVSLAEEMPASETEELDAALRDLGMRPSLLVVNQVLPSLVRDRAAATLAAAGVLAAEPALAGLARAARTRLAREELQHQMLLRLARLGIPLVHLPALVVDQVRRAGMDLLAGRLAASLAPARAAE